MWHRCRNAYAGAISVASPRRRRRSALAANTRIARVDKADCQLRCMVEAVETFYDPGWQMAKSLNLEVKPAEPSSVSIADK